MGWFNLLALACALAMDAFAVAVTSGIMLNPLTRRRLFRMSFHFGLFQSLMPALGWAAGRAVYEYIQSFDHWIAFILLGFIGGRMFLGAIRDNEEHKISVDPTRGWNLVVLSVATSVDALAVGLSLAALGLGILMPAVIIGIIAAAFTLTGMLLGRRIGALWGRRVEALGGIILIAIGIRILLEHLGNQ